MKEGWEYKKLGEVCELKRGLTYAGGDEVPMSDNCVLRSNNVNLDTMALDLSELKYLRPDFNIPSDKKVKKDSILICMSNGSKKHIGKVAFIDKEMDFAFGGFMGLIIPDNDTCPKYIYFGCRSTLFKKFLDGIGEGANIKNLRFQDLEKFSIPLPPLSEQQSIVAELDKINEIIDLKKAQLKDLDLLAQSIFYDMFGDPIENSKGREVKKLGEIVSFKNGLNFGKNEQGYNYKLLGVSDFKANSTVSSDSLGIVSLSSEISNDYLLKNNDIVFVRSNGSKDLVGRCVLVNVYEDTTFSGFCIRCRIESNDVVPIFLLTVLKTDCMRAYLTQSGQGCNISNLNQKILSSTQIPLPPLSLQQSFASKIQAIESQKSAIKQSLTDAETLLASRMDYWFN